MVLNDSKWSVYDDITVPPPWTRLQDSPDISTCFARSRVDIIDSSQNIERSELQVHGCKSKFKMG